MLTMSPLNKMRLLVAVCLVSALNAHSSHHGSSSSSSSSSYSSGPDADINEAVRYDELPLTGASQLSYTYGGEAHKAIDGDPTTYSEAYRSSYGFYLKVSIPLAYVKAVVIYAAPEKDRKLKKYDICVKSDYSTVECISISNTRASYQGTVHTFYGNSYGSDIYITQMDGGQNVMPIGEVRVFGQHYLEQVPLLTPAMYGSTSFPAVNGVSNNLFTHFKTSSDPASWWAADFGQERRIYRVLLYTYLPEYENVGTLNIILSKYPITDTSSRESNSYTHVLTVTITSAARSGGVYPDPWVGFDARYIRVEKTSIYSLALSLTNVQVFASETYDTYNQNWGFTSSGCARLASQADDLKYHTVDCGTDTYGMLSGFSMREHSSCSGNELKMESYCSNAKVGSCSTRQTSCMNLKSGLQSITSAVDCSSIGAIKNWEAVSSGCSSNQLRISYNCCPLVSPGSDRVESTPCVEVVGQQANVFQMFRTHCLENEVMTKWEFTNNGCPSNSDYRRIEYTCRQSFEELFPSMRVSGTPRKTTFYFADILADVNPSCDGHTLGLCMTEHWYELAVTDYSNAVVTRSSGSNLKWSSSDSTGCKYFKFAFASHFGGDIDSRAVWMVGHNCDGDGGAKIVTITPENGVVTFSDNTQAMRYPILLQYYYEEFRLATYYSIGFDDEGDCANNLLTCKVNSVWYSSGSRVARLGASSDGSLPHVEYSYYAVLNIKKISGE